MHNPVITAWIQEQPVDLQPIFLQLRQIIFEEIPHVKEYMAYQLPFYGCYGRLCYFNHRKGIAELGLCQGAFLSNDQNLLMGEGKEVRCMHEKFSRYESNSHSFYLARSYIIESMEKAN